jgi:hypothetical protein
MKEMRNEDSMFSSAWKRLECKEMTSTFLSQNLSFWNLDFLTSPGAIFQEARIQNFIIDTEHKSTRHLFEQT